MKKREPPSRIPWWVRLALRLLIPPEDSEAVLGDLEESSSAGGRRHPRARSSPFFWWAEILSALTWRITRSPPPPLPQPQRVHMLADLLRDVRFALRQMARRPGGTAAVLLILAVGIGANTAIFSLVHGVLLKPLPYPESHRLVVLRETNLARGWTSFSLSPDNFLDWRERTRAFDLMAAYQGTSVTWTGTDLPEVLRAYRVTEDYQEALGLGLAHGRGILEEDLDPGAPSVAVLDHGFWQRAFGGDPSVVGESLELGGGPVTIVGVLREGWRPLNQTRGDLLLPLPLSRHPTRRGGHWLSAVARLRPGMNPAQAQEEVASVAAALEVEFPPSNEGWGASVIGLGDFIWGAQRAQLLLFMGAVTAVLLLACANVAIIMVVRAMARTREMAIRLALGAGRMRVVRQCLVEHLLMTAMGSVLGLGVAYLTLHGLLWAWPGALPRMDQVGIGPTAFLFACVVGITVGLAMGLAVLRPWGRLARGHSFVGLSQRWMPGGDRSRFTRGLVVVQMGLAVLLLVGSGLLIRSFKALEQVDPGFEAANRLVFSTPLPQSRYATPGEIQAYASATLQRLQTVPGVVSTAISTFVPLRGGVDVRWQVTLEGRSPPESSTPNEVHLYRISPDFFQAMGIPLQRGRLFSASDGLGAHPVVVVSRSFVRAHFPAEDPLGRRIRIGGGELPFAEIVGVVGDVRDLSLAEASLPQVYEPFGQRERAVASLAFVSRISRPPDDLVEALRAKILEVDPDQPLVAIQSLEESVDEYVALPRFRTFLLSAFGTIALLLACMGVYGVVSFAVGQRFHEFGVRMALGADGASILAQVFRDGAHMILTGIAAGTVAALALSRLLESVLFGVGARDVSVFVVTPLLLLASAGLATLIPALRATRIEAARTLAGD